MPHYDPFQSRVQSQWQDKSLFTHTLHSLHACEVIIYYILLLFVVIDCEIYFTLAADVHVQLYL